MKPVFLSMQAFGPFSGTEEINFSDLGDSPLFLINGPTGSGKTTILDAICYALYGTTSGDERDGAEMRCQQSDAALLTEVIFEFDLGGKTYRITRSPEQNRPKKKVEGMTTHKPQATLYKYDAGGTPETGELLVERKVQEATEQIRNITGMNAEQFRQVMVLPQGQFRKLLMSDSKDREKIFQSLFQTSVYKAIEEKLKAASAGIRAAVAEGRSEIRGILDMGDLGGEDELTKSLDIVSSELKVLVKAKDKTEKIWRRAEAALKEAIELEDAFEHFEKTQQKESGLKARASDIDALRKQVAQANEALKIEPLYRRLLEHQGAFNTAGKGRANADGVLTSAIEAKDKAEKSFKKEEGRAEERDTAQKNLHTLNSYSGKVEQLSGARLDYQTAVADKSSASISLTEAENAVQDHVTGEIKIKANVEGLGVEIEKATGIDIQVHKLSLAAENRGDLVSIEQEIKEKQSALERARARINTAESSRDEAAKSVKYARKLWHQGQAALLARELEEGSPCPVCGSELHPALAEAATETASEEDIEVATAHFDQAVEAVGIVNNEIAAYVSQLSTMNREKEKLTLKLGIYAEQSEQDIAVTLMQSEALAKKLEGDQEALVTAVQSQQYHSDKLGELSSAVDQTKKTMAKADIAITQAQTRVSLAERDLPEQFREAGKLKKAIEVALSQLQSMQLSFRQATARFQEADKARGAAESKLLLRVEHHTSAEVKLEEAKEEASDALESSPFGTEQEMQLASMAEKDREGISAQIKEYEGELLKTNTLRKALEDQLKGKVLGDIEALENAEKGARSKRTEALKEWRIGDQRKSTLKAIKRKLKIKKIEMSSLEAQYAIVGTLAEVACGHTDAKVSLQRFILGVLLDEVLVQATQRLMKMSGGRYELIRKREANKGKRPAGLDLEVYDDYSGQSRSVATLSGGESFMAALSLALGLSDVVQRQTGGIQLDTLFVDEGFGTLDSEALELAVSTLMDLQKAGRMVGIISHVSELKEQMDVRIDLSMSQGGSSLKVVSSVV